MSTTAGKPSTFDVHETGPPTVIAFGDRDQSDVSTPAGLAELDGLLASADSSRLVVDLAGVRLIASGVLGMLARTANRGVDVTLLNASADIVEVLEVTNLDKLISVEAGDGD
ncbi:MAG: STAS domain-containing protein [Planctomycetota bacterium]